MKLNIQRFADGRVIIEASLDAKSFDRQIAELEYKLQDLEENYKLALKDKDFPKEALRQYETEIEKTKNKIISLREQQDKMNIATTEQGFKLGNTIKQISRWALALFGIRSAYSFIRQSASSLANTNKSIGTNIEYMRWALSQMLEKVVVKLVQWAFKLLQIINYVVYGVTGINLFANASAKAFEKQNKAMKGTSKSAKELQKTLAGFDEMNIIQKDGSTSVGGGGGGLPTTDLSKFTEISGTLKEKLDRIIEVLKPVWEWITKIVKKLGGVQSVILGLIGLKLIQKVASLLGVAGGVGGAGASGLLGVLSVLGLLVADVWLIKVAWEGVKEAKKEADNLNNKLDSLKETTKKSNESWKKNSKELVENAKAGKYDEEQLKKVADSLLNDAKNSKAVSESLEEQKTAVGFLTGAWGKATQVQAELNDEYENDIKLLKELNNADLLSAEQKKQLIPYLEEEIKHYEQLRDMHSEGSTKAKEYQKKIDELKLSLDKTKGTYTATININANDKNARKTIVDLLGDIGSAGIEGALGLKTSVANAIKKIKYAKGGIINMPGRGIPIGGENGREGIVPLTDNQQMALLGQEIGKWIVVNANITNTMNGRVISRELQKIQNENSFASNL